MKQIRVLIVEDSVTQREILCRILRADEEMVVVGEATNGAIAVEQAQTLAPDVVLMDVHMDTMDGIEATRIIMKNNPLPIVIMSSTLQKRDIDLAVEALRVGAVSVIEKPKGAALLHLAKMAPKLVQALREAAATTVRKTPFSPNPASTPSRSHYQPPKQAVRVIGVASSAGGPSVLVQIFSALPSDYEIPILLVQHISAGFEEGFANWLSLRTGLPAKIATDGQKLSPGIWLGPTGKHIVMKTTRHIGLLPRRNDDIHCPAANPLLSSIAETLGSSSVGIVLTGMGDDGANGLLSIKQAGGQTIIQDKASSMVWGMPKAAKAKKAHDYELSAAEIAAALCRLTGK